MRTLLILPILFVLVSCSKAPLVLSCTGTRSLAVDNLPPTFHTFDDAYTIVFAKNYFTVQKAGRDPVRSDYQYKQDNVEVRTTGQASQDFIYLEQTHTTFATPDDANSEVKGQHYSFNRITGEFTQYENEINTHNGKIVRKAFWTDVGSCTPTKTRF